MLVAVGLIFLFFFVACMAMCKASKRADEMETKYWKEKENGR